MWKWLNRFKKPKLESSAPTEVTTSVTTQTESGTSESFTISRAEYDAFNRALKETNAASKRIRQIEDDARKTLRIAENTRNFVVAGFLVMFLVLIGLAFDYWTYTRNLNESIRLETANKEKLNQVQYQLETLKKCLGAGSWKGCLL